MRFRFELLSFSSYAFLLLSLYKKRLMDVIDSHCMKKQNKEGLGFTADRISALPDDIISNILSFLSTREAASTSVLSPRWSDLWKHTPNLDLFDINSIGHKSMKTTEIEHNSWDAETCKHIKAVNSALESHQAHFLKQFRICFYINKSAQSAVTKWLEFVGSRRVERLELDFLCLSAKHRVVLGDLRPLKCLETLCLGSLQMSGEDISLFLRNCPLLRKLCVIDSSLMSDVHVSGATLALNHLEIRNCNDRDFGITISAPNLSIVSVDAAPGKKLRFENVPKLVFAKFRITSPRYTKDHFCYAISCLTSQLQKLTLSTLCYKKLLREGFPQLSNLKTLIIADWDKHDHKCLLAATHVISACPRLQKFILYFDLVRSRGATTYYEKCKRLVFKGSSAANIIQSVTYISGSDAFQKINTWTALMNEDSLSQIKAQLCQQVQLQFDVYWF